MLEVIKMVPPSPEQFDAVFHGMRHAFKSYDRSDSFFCKKSFVSHENGTLETYVKGEFILGANDKNLAINLVKAGNPSHRKFLRQLPIILEIKAPEYWYKQLDAYKVGIVMNSQSQMHNLADDKWLTFDDFSFDYDAADTIKNGWMEYDEDGIYIGNHGILFDSPGSWSASKEEVESYANPVPLIFSSYLNNINILLREFRETKDKKYWDLANQMLPQSYNYVRTVSMNYEVALQIIEQRTNHKLVEWKTLIDELLKLPYMQEFAEAAGLTEVEE